MSSFKIQIRWQRTTWIKRTPSPKRFFGTGVHLKNNEVVTYPSPMKHSLKYGTGQGWFNFRKVCFHRQELLDNLGQVDTDVEKLLLINMKFNKVSLPWSSSVRILNDGQVQQHFCSFFTFVFFYLRL